MGRGNNNGGGGGGGDGMGLGNGVRWLVWSFEHGGWWGAGGSGYTLGLREAGRYTLGEAMEICDGGNRYGEVMNEIMVGEGDGVKFQRRLEVLERTGWK